MRVEDCGAGLAGGPQSYQPATSAFASEAVPIEPSALRSTETTSASRLGADHRARGENERRSYIEDDQRVGHQRSPSLRANIASTAISAPPRA